MAEDRKRRYVLGGVAALCIAILAVAILLGTQAGKKPTGNSVPAPPGNSSGGGPPNTGAWTTYTPRQSLLVKAEDAKELLGEMKLDSALDNEKVLAPDGTRALAEFVGAPDEACEKGKEAESKARFELEVKHGGTYYPWARVWWKDSCGDSMAVHMQLSGEDKPVGFPAFTDGLYKSWHWVPLAGSKGVQLKEGTYEIIAENREDGARLSRILFSPQDYETHMPVSPEG